MKDMDKMEEIRQKLNEEAKRNLSGEKCLEISRKMDKAIEIYLEKEKGFKAKKQMPS